MSPSKHDVGAAKQTEAVVVIDGPNKVDVHQIEEKSAAPVTAMDKVLAMLEDLSERMNRMKVSEKEQIGKHQKGSSESSIFGSFLGGEAGMSLQALEHIPPPKNSPNVSPATYFEARLHVEGSPADNFAADFNMGPDIGHMRYRQGMPAGYYPGVGMPNRMYAQPGSQVAGMPDAQHRKLALQLFDGKELYHGLGSGSSGGVKSSSGKSVSLSVRLFFLSRRH